MASEGVHLILVARTLERLEEIRKIVEQKGATADIFALDLRDETARNELIQKLQQHTDGIDIFISNAGKSIRRSLVDSLDRFHDFRRTMDV